MRHPWTIGNNGAGARPWFVIRERVQVDGIWTEARLADRYHENDKGDLIRYKRADTAQAVANGLNRKESA